MPRHSVLLLTALAVAGLGAAGLGGCGGPPTSSGLALGSSQGAGQESALSSQEQDQLAAQDTDQLTDNPLAEPGSVHADGILPGPPPGDLPNFGTINDHLYRGARPTAAGFTMLKSKGVNLVIDLENGSSEVKWERSVVESAGMKFMSLPMGVIIPPSVAKVNVFLNAVNDPASPSVYFHCMQGRDRTGTMAFCYRVKHDRWDTQRAYAEMKSFHFHTYLLGLNLFVHWYGATYGPDND